MHARIKALRDAAAAAVARQKALVELAEKEGRAFTAEEQTAFDADTAAVDKALADIVPLEAMVERAAKVDAVRVPAAPEQRDVTGAIDRVTQTTRTVETVPAIPKSPDEWKVKMGCYAWAAGRAKKYPRKSAFEHMADFGLQQLVDESRAHTEAELKTIVSQFGTGNGNPLVVRAITTLSSGGADNMVNTPLASEFIEFLKAESAFFAGGPTEIPMPLGSLDISGGNAGTAGTYHAQDADLGYTQATTRKVSLSAKHIGAITAINNFALETSPLPVAAIFGDELARSIVLGMDAAGLRGDGSGQNPTGVRSLVHSSHKYDATAAVDDAAPTIAEIDAEARKAIGKFDAALIPNRRRRWTMAYRTFRYLQFLKDSQGNYAYPGLQLATPTWHGGYPVIPSEQVPTNLGGGTNASEIYLIDYGHVIVGVTRTLRLDASTEASYKDSGGTLISAFSRDQTVIRGQASHDFDMRHTKAAICIEAVLWGT